MELFQLISLGVLMIIAKCSCELAGFESNLCEEKKTEWVGYSLGYLVYDSSLENIRYDWCSCTLCDEADSKNEQTVQFHPETVLLYKTGQTFNYATPLGTGWSNSTWINNTEEGTIGTSLYTRCPTFTLNLRGAAARVRLNLNLMVNRSKITVDCQVAGFFTISDSVDSDGQISPPDEGGFRNVGVAIGLGVGALLIVFSVAGVCVYCKLSKRRASGALTKDEYNRNSVVNNSYGDPKPEIHRNLDMTAMTINATTFLDENSPTNENGTPDPGYEAVGTPETETEPINSAYDNSAFITEDETPGSSLYHTLSETRPESQLISPENEQNVQTKQEDYLKPETKVDTEQEEETTSQQAEENHYEDIGTPRAKENTTATTPTSHQDEDNPENLENTQIDDVPEDNTEDNSAVNEVADEYSVINKSRSSDKPSDDDQIRERENIVTEL